MARMTLRIWVACAVAIASAVCAAGEESMKVRAKDGAEISVDKAGAGPALLLVHGSGVDARFAWQAVVPALSRNFTVYTMDRRGRGSSGDGKSYSLAAEADDLVAVVRRIGQPVTVVAHSYGALCAVAALDRLKNVSSLILYEPALLVQAPGPQWGKVLEQMDDALAAQDREKVAAIFLRDAVGVPAAAVEGMRGSPAFAKQVETSGTLPREARAVGEFRPSPAALKLWKAPTTMLVGAQTQGFLKNASEYVCSTIPGCRLVTLENQGHMAMAMAPELFVAKVREAAAVGAAR
jgi:pimeloyl-ACP methyl ester carboxylesterase